MTSRSAQVLFRYRTGDVLSGWMTADQLRTHATGGKIKPESSIQQVGKEQWVPAAKVPGLWVAKESASSSGASAAGRSGSTAGADAVEDTHHDGGGPGDSRATSRNGGSERERGAVGTGGEHASGGQPAVHAHQMRVGESLSHLLQRAVLGCVTVCAPEFTEPQKAKLAGVMVDAFALEFEGCSTVVFVPWATLRGVALPSSAAHSTGRIKEQTGGLVLDLEHVPGSVAHALQAAHG